MRMFKLLASLNSKATLSSNAVGFLKVEVQSENYLSAQSKSVSFSVYSLKRFNISKLFEADSKHFVFCNPVDMSNFDTEPQTFKLFKASETLKTQRLKSGITKLQKAIFSQATE